MRVCISMQAESVGVVWCMERSTFRSIIVVSSMQKRQRYEECLVGMPLFASLTPDQRAAIADCLSLDTFQVRLLPNMLAACAALFFAPLLLHTCQCADSVRAVTLATFGTGHMTQRQKCSTTGTVPFSVASDTVLCFVRCSCDTVSLAPLVSPACTTCDSHAFD